MESFVGDPGFYLVYEAFRQAALEEVEGQIDKIPFPENLDQRKLLISVPAYLVMPFNHQTDFFCPGGMACFCGVVFSLHDRRWYVSHSLV